MPSIFVSYRRSDAPAHAAWLYEGLAQRFGAENVFKDVDDMEPGADFVEVIEDAIGRCDVLLAVIGRGWLEARHRQGRRLDDPQDWVRLEIRAALERKIRVIPVLVAGASMPASAELPEALQPLARRQAHELVETAWKPTLVGLLDVLERVFARQRVSSADEPGDRAMAPPVASPRTAPEAGSETPLRASIAAYQGFQWQLPSVALLKRWKAEQIYPGTAREDRTAAELSAALARAGVPAQITGVVVAFAVARVELRLPSGITPSQLADVRDELGYRLAVSDIDILPPAGGGTAASVDVPHQRRQLVQLGDVFRDAPSGWSPLTVWLGKDDFGRAIGADLSKSHLLLAGTTAAGRCGAISAMLSSLLLGATPHELRLLLIDAHQVELDRYASIPHLLTPVITRPRTAAAALRNLVGEMQQRYSIMSIAGTHALIELNTSREQRGDAPLPYILCVVGELADLMTIAPAGVEDSISRLAQKGPAVGIHLVLATRFPRADVLTDSLKANVPSRIALSVSSELESRMILDHSGAESLGPDEMLFSAIGSARLTHIFAAHSDGPQVQTLTDCWRRQAKPELRADLLDGVGTDDDAADRVPEG